MHFSVDCISAHVREAASINVLLVLYNSALQHDVSFREWISFWTNQVSQWFNGPFRCVASQCAYLYYALEVCTLLLKKKYTLLSV